MQYRKLRSILGRYPLDARSILHPVVDNQKYLQTLAMSPGEQNCLWLRITKAMSMDEIIQRKSIN